MKSGWYPCTVGPISTPPEVFVSFLPLLCNMDSLRSSCEPQTFDLPAATCKYYVLGLYVSIAMSLIFCLFGCVWDGTCEVSPVVWDISSSLLIETVLKFLMVKTSRQAGPSREHLQCQYSRLSQETCYKFEANAWLYNDTLSKQTNNFLSQHASPIPIQKQTTTPNKNRNLQQKWPKMNFIVAL